MSGLKFIGFKAWNCPECGKKLSAELDKNGTAKYKCSYCKTFQVVQRYGDKYVITLYYGQENGA